MSHICAFVSERGGIRCQFSIYQHERWGCHMAWNGLTLILKIQGEFVPEPPVASSGDPGE